MQEKRTSTDVLKVQGIMEKGYGIIPKIPMQDTRLSIEAKGIYSYFRSFAGAGTTAFPSREKILHDLQIGEMRYYKHFNLLKQYGYIAVEQNTDSTGKFKNNIYTLMEVIEPYPQNRGTEPYPHFPGTDNPDTENEGTKNNSLKNNSLNNQQSNPIVSNRYEKPEKEKTDMIGYDTTSNQSVINRNEQKNKESLENATSPSATHLPKPSAVKYNYTEVEQIIKNQIFYDYLIADSTARKDILDEIVFVITTTICTEYKDGYISMGEERVPAEAVRAVFFKLSSEHIEYFIDCFNRQTETITKLPPYIRKSLYYNYGTVSHHYINRVHHDMPQLAERKL